MDIYWIFTKHPWISVDYLWIIHRYPQIPRSRFFRIELLTEVDEVLLGGISILCNCSLLNAFYIQKELLF